MNKRDPKTGRFVKKVEFVLADDAVVQDLTQLSARQIRDMKRRRDVR